ncbi:MAG: DUF309 domain-containing protein [Planctomycetota bacterium]
MMGIAPVFVAGAAKLTIMRSGELGLEFNRPRRHLAASVQFGAGGKKVSTTKRQQALERWSGGDYLGRLASDLLRPVDHGRRTFPAYTFVPGHQPHPWRDPAGHSFGRERVEAGEVDSKNWGQHPLWNEGLDLFNHGYFWEAHEALEALWHGLGREGPVADLLRALIKACAAHLKAFDDQNIGPRTLARRAAEEIEGLLDRDGALVGVVWSQRFETELRHFLSEHRNWFETLLAEGPVLPAFPFLRFHEPT